MNNLINILYFIAAVLFVYILITYLEGQSKYIIGKEIDDAIRNDKILATDAYRDFLIDQDSLRNGNKYK